MAQHTTRWRSWTALALSVAVGFALAGWHGGSASAMEVPQLKAGDIADAVLFNDGPAAQYLTALRRPNFRWSEELRAIQRSVRSAVEADSKFAATFAARMQSGDPRQCQSAMSDLGLLARRVLYARYGDQRVDQLARLVDSAFGEKKILLDAILNHQFDLDDDINLQLHTIFVLDTDFTRDTSWHADVEALLDTAVDTVTPVTLVLATIDVFNLPMENSERSQLAGEVLINHFATDLRAGAPR